MLANWSFSGIGQLDGATNAASTNPFPIGTYSNSLSVDNSKLEEFKLYPNPTVTGKVTISSRNSSVISAQVFDILGKQVLQADLNNNELNVSSLRTGLYIVKLTQDEATITKKLVIK
jgi:hypothetical protein